MPREHKSRREVVNAIKSIPSLADLLSTHDGHFDYELDLEVIVYGRNYGGKKVGPYVRLLTFEPGETIIKEGDWGGNTFYVAVEGKPDVYIDIAGRGNSKVAELTPGTQFGEMSVLAGVARNATVKAPATQAVQILEVDRPALRLLRKLPKFSEVLDRTYRVHGRNSLIEELVAITGLPNDSAKPLASIAQFRVFSRNHVLLREGAPIDRVFILKSGWIRRSQERDQQTSREKDDFLGEGHCLGLEGVARDARWPYTVTLLGRTEVLEVSINKLRQDVTLRDAFVRALARFAAPETIGDRVSAEPGVREKVLETQERLIETGLVDGTNLLVMDMNLCVRCGNCSLACHKIHGQSRLLRRGIHVERLESPRASSSLQSLLSPAVCMHCQDPECLTGCPTGAIGRMVGGHIDINSKTCIGCGDCATQCPYNAISLVSRKAAPAPVRSFASRMSGLFKLRPDPLPQAVEQTEELLAVKCNLCDNTPMNPPGARRRAYACEEACPTGALARINPKQYFAEIGAIEGLAFLDKTHALARNIHRSDPPRRMLHLAGIIITILLAGAAIFGIASYGLGGRISGFLNMRWITGLVGLVGIAGVMTYPVRRKIYTKRKGSLRYWLLVHSYLGVLAGIMLLLHGGSDSGGALTTALMVSFDLVILTGLFGILCYVIVPRMLTRIEGEPLLLDDLRARRSELQIELAELAAAQSGSDTIKRKIIPRYVSFGYLIRQYLKRESLDEAVRVAREEQRGRVASAGEDQREIERAVEAAVTLRRVDALIYLHRVLKAWLIPHVVFTSLMLALMVVHIIQVIYFA